MADTKGSAGSTPARKLRHTVVPLPKIVFFYPLMIVCIICAIMEASNGSDPNKVAGTMFIIVFLVNILIIAFDFPGVKAMALAMVIIATIFGLLWANSKWGIIAPMKDFFDVLFDKVNASTMFYCMISAILFLMVVMGILANFLWNRWVIESSRIYHKHGLFGDVREYPVIDLQVQKSIDDIFEYALLLSGTLTFSVPNAPTIRLENVPFINRVEKKIQTIVRK
ncbi:hypothetical protein [Candidatus Uabimicrobium sp. HlEnr_7]|uniref:hypothetical protein n=1 Tax=Candidatus Uabimicrobium helgolandensis TaxID=3095367 RepID=UPI0035560F8D